MEISAEQERDSLLCPRGWGPRLPEETMIKPRAER
jgi:hypothetical protein